MLWFQPAVPSPADASPRPDYHHPWPIMPSPNTNVSLPSIHEMFPGMPVAVSAHPPPS